MSPCIFDNFDRHLSKLLPNPPFSALIARVDLETSLISANQTKATTATKVKSSTCLTSKATSLATEATSLATAQSGRFGRATTATA